MKRKLTTIFVLISLTAAVMTGCLDERSTLEVATHPEGWNEKSSTDFHGAAVLSNSLSLESCRSCHGENFQGGTSNLSCFAAGCHAVFPHPEGFAEKMSPNFHGEFIAEMLQWNILDCQSCHGNDYAGNGVSEKNCLTCHQDVDGPENCSTCHGSAGNPAPPRDLSKNIRVSARGVGGHQVHLSGDTWSTATMKCNTCHTVPQQYAEGGHIDSSPRAELNFGPLATFGGKVEPVYDRDAASCANVYCHGAFEFPKSESQYPWAYTEESIRGNNPKLFWTTPDAGQAFCGTCHGLPPKGHIAAASCESCHSRVVDRNFNIIDKSLHINGKVDVFN